MSILPGNKAPWFSSIGFQENKFMDISINDYTGRWLILFFYPLDFGYVSIVPLGSPQSQLKRCFSRVSFSSFPMLMNFW